MLIRVALARRSEGVEGRGQWGGGDKHRGVTGLSLKGGRPSTPPHQQPSATPQLHPSPFQLPLRRFHNRRPPAPQPCSHPRSFSGLRSALLWPPLPPRVCVWPLAGPTESLEGGGGRVTPSPLPTALALPQRHSHTPNTSPNHISNRQKPPPPTAFASPVTALQPLWDCPDGPPPLQAKPWQALHASGPLSCQLPPAPCFTCAAKTTHPHPHPTGRPMQPPTGARGMPQNPHHRVPPTYGAYTGIARGYGPDPRRRPQGVRPQGYF